MKGASGPGPKPARGQTAAAFNAGRMPGARYTKSFNTLTSRFQAEAAGRTGEKRVVQWICGDDPRAESLVAKLIEDIGYVPGSTGGSDRQLDALGDLCGISALSPHGVSRATRAKSPVPRPVGLWFLASV